MNEEIAFNVEEIGRRYEDDGFFVRFFKMCSGLRMAKTTPEYKKARIELQRLAAPVVALLTVTMFVSVLIVVTAIQSVTKESVEITVATVDDTDVEIDEEPEPPDVTTDTVVVDEAVEIDIAVPQPEVAMVAPPAPAPGGEIAKVQHSPSPVVMDAIAGTVKMRGLGDGADGFGSVIGGGKGSAQNLEGCLIGTIIDFKSDKDGNPRREYSADGSYWSDAKSLVDAKWSADAMSRFFVPNKRVALTHLWIPPQSASNGPKAFNVEKEMKPSGFAVYYKGSLKASDKPRKCRFWGYFDDFMYIEIDGKTVYDSVWSKGGLDKGRMTGWTTSDRAAVGSVKCPQNNGKMGPSDWFTIDSKKDSAINLMVGERPGGHVGGLLLIQEEGVEYERNPDGTLILPIFATRPLSNTMKLSLAEDGKYRMSTDSPRFNARPQKVAEATKDDVSVEVSI